jgi:hypothetical protein
MNQLIIQIFKSLMFCRMKLIKTSLASPAYDTIFCWNLVIASFRSFAILGMADNLNIFEFLWFLFIMINTLECSWLTINILMIQNQPIILRHGVNRVCIARGAHCKRHSESSLCDWYFFEPLPSINSQRSNNNNQNLLWSQSNKNSLNSKIF